MELTSAENTDGLRKRRIQALKPGGKNMDPNLPQRSTDILLTHLITPAISESGAPNSLFRPFSHSFILSSSSPPFHFFFLLHINGQTGCGNARQRYINQLLCLLTSAAMLIHWVTQPGLTFPAAWHLAEIEILREPISTDYRSSSRLNKFPDCSFTDSGLHCLHARCVISPLT